MSNYLEVLEHYIDGEILKQFENSHKIKIDLSYPRLSQAIKNWGDLFREIKQYRRYKISNLIDKKYEDGGWKIGIDISDGMGMASYEYWVLTPKDDK